EVGGGSGRRGAGARAGRNVPEVGSNLLRDGMIGAEGGNEGGEGAARGILRLWLTPLELNVCKIDEDLSRFWMRISVRVHGNSQGALDIGLGQRGLALLEKHTAKTGQHGTQFWVGGPQNLLLDGEALSE